MNKNIYIFLIFFWTLIFPNLSLNRFTTDITNNNYQYSDLFNSESRSQILEKAEYDLWIKTIFLSSHE